MKTCFLTAVLALASLGARADGHFHHYAAFCGPRFSFYYAAPVYGGWYSPGYCETYYPSYAYSYPAIGYEYSRPDYAVSGTLGGALIGGVIGNSIHHQGWEGAGIGAAAGLVLGSLAEAGARHYENNYSYSTPSAYYSYSSPSTRVQSPPAASATTAVSQPRNQSSVTYQTTSSMSSANALFGR